MKAPGAYHYDLRPAEYSRFPSHSFPALLERVNFLFPLPRKPEQLSGESPANLSRLPEEAGPRVLHRLLGVGGNSDARGRGEESKGPRASGNTCRNQLRGRAVDRWP